MSKRKAPADRQQEILDAALQCAERTGALAMTREQVAARAGVSPGLVSHYWATMAQLKRDVFRAAVKRGAPLKVIAEGLAARNSACCKAPEELRKRALGSLL